MKNQIKAGILKETKIPPDRRVAVPPELAKKILERFPNVRLSIQKSDIRCYRDYEYEDKGLIVTEDISDCDIMIGVKEVDMPALIPGKTYLFFSHTAKKQSYNRKLLQEIAKKQITLVDYEYLTDKNNMRLVAFGRWAGIVGAYNGLIAYGKRYDLYHLKSAHLCHDMDEMIGELGKVKLPPVKILITGGGRVAFGAIETLEQSKLKRIDHEDFLHKSYQEAVYCQIDPWHYTKRKNEEKFDLQHFFDYPAEYESTFKPYTKVTDLFMPCHFWDPRSPVFMTSEDYKSEDFKIKVIADISCDIKIPIPSTLRASTIADPFYGYDPIREKESDPFDNKNITVMAVDNLPGELPRDSSVYFGERLMDTIFSALFGDDPDGMIKRATIVEKGKLTGFFNYLQDYLAGRE